MIFRITQVEITKDKEVEIIKDKEVEITKETPVVDITNVVIPVNVNDEDEEITDEVYELKRMEKGKIVEETRNSPIPTPIRSPRIHTNLVSSDIEKLQELTDIHTTSSSSSPHTKFMPRKSFDTLADNLHDVMVETLPTMVDKHIKDQVMNQVPEQVRNQVPVYMSGHIFHIHPAQSQTSSVPYQQYQLYLALKADPQLQQHDIAIWLALQMKFERNTIPQTACRTHAVHPRDQDDPHDDAHPEGDNSNQEQDDDFDFCTNSYASDDDEIPTKQVSQDIMEEVSLIIDEAKLRKMADEMLRQRCTSGDEHLYHIDQMKNFLKSDIPDYKNLNKNDIEDIYMLIMNGKVPDYADTGLLWSLSEARSRVQDLTSGEIVSLNFIESIKEARSRVQDLTSGEIVSLNLLSRTRKFGHSTMELRSLIS
ncbi:hypothetical protein Tco_1346245 [Tanacetum coccineum]